MLKVVIHLFKAVIQEAVSVGKSSLVQESENLNQ